MKRLIEKCQRRKKIRSAERTEAGVLFFALTEVLVVLDVIAVLFGTFLRACSHFNHDGGFGIRLFDWE